MQIEAPFRPLTEVTPSFLLTMKPWPSWNMMPTKSRPILASRLKVQVVLRARTSISPDCSAVKRSVVVTGTNLTFSGSLNTAAATARQ